MPARKSLLSTVREASGWGVYSLGVSGGFTPLRTNVSFAGTLILDLNNAAYSDRIGSNRGSGARFYPYGDEITSTGDDREKFGTYLRDHFTGFDYADQRYYASASGRFNTADPSTSSAGPSDPVSWNRYSYTGGDPVNRLDPGGTDWCDANSGNCFLGSAPGAPPPCGGIYQNAMFAFGDLNDPNPFIAGPDAATYWAQLQATGCGQQIYAQIIPAQAAASPPPAKQQCVVEFGEAPALSKYLPGEHTYFYVKESSGTWDVIDAGPEFGPYGKVVTTTIHVGRHPVEIPTGLTWGKLVTTDQPGGLYNENVTGTIYWTYPGSNSCQLASNLGGLAADLNGISNYGFPNPNSNSFTYTLDKDLNLNIPDPPGFTPGWGTTIP